MVVRDEEWLVTRDRGDRRRPAGPRPGPRRAGPRHHGQLLRDASTRSTPLDPAAGQGGRRRQPAATARARLWLESTFRKTAVPLGDPALTVSTQALADPLSYQQSAVRKALDPANLRPRILLADAVGLGKTLEIGMILSELVRRGRGDRILIVTPRHVLEQMQHEMWTRFALPFVRLDSAGIQRVRQKLPATRNPFTYYKRVIISIDTLKSDRYVASLQQAALGRGRHRRVAQPVQPATLNNRLARLLSRNTEALILASATPHNGRSRLVRRADPAARPVRRPAGRRAGRRGDRAAGHPPAPAQPRGRQRGRRRLGRAAGAEQRAGPGLAGRERDRRRAGRRLAVPGGGRVALLRAERVAVPVDAGQGVPVLARRAARDDRRTARPARRTTPSAERERHALDRLDELDRRGAGRRRRPSTTRWSSTSRRSASARAPPPGRSCSPSASRR